MQATKASTYKVDWKKISIIKKIGLKFGLEVIINS